MGEEGLDGRGPMRSRSNRCILVLTSTYAEMLQFRQTGQRTDMAFSAGFIHVHQAELHEVSKLCQRLVHVFIRVHVGQVQAIQMGAGPADACYLNSADFEFL